MHSRNTIVKIVIPYRKTNNKGLSQIKEDVNRDIQSLHLIFYIHIYGLLK